MFPTLFARLLFLFLLPFSVTRHFALSSPVLDSLDSMSSRPAIRLLSQDLAVTLQHASDAAYGLQQRIAKTAHIIDTIAALVDDTSISRRAAAACKIADNLFPGQVFAKESNEYQS